ncbi:MAG: hypothetical protein AAF823_15460 [Planctomycetota bacterium]
MDATEARPPRYRWLRRLIVAHGVLVVALLGVQLAWGAAMEARLAAAVQEIRDRGEPVETADFESPVVADEDNAVWHIQEALAKWPRVNGLLVIETDWASDPEDHDDPVEDSEAYLAAIADSLDHIDRAADASQVILRSAPATRPLLLTFDTSHLLDFRLLSRQLVDAARREALAGRHGRAAEHLARLVTVSGALRSERSLAIDLLVAISIDSMIYRGLHERLAVGDDFANAPFDPVMAADQSPHAVARLRDHFVDISSRHAALAESLRWERLFLIDVYRAVMSHDVSLHGAWPTMGQGVPERALVVAMRPHFTRDMVFGLGRYDWLILRLEAEQTWPEFAGSFVELERLERQLESNVLHPMMHSSKSGWSAVMRTHFQTQNRGPVMAVALAVWMYEADHGRRPETLDALVPEYLAAVPADPWASDRRPIGYLPEGAPARWVDGHRMSDLEVAEARGKFWPVVYSIGIDDEDDGGSPSFYGGLAYSDMAGFREDMGGDEVVMLDEPPMDLEPMAGE